MFKYISMPKLVAFYLREFSVRKDGTPSLLYKFIFCLCLPFFSKTFNRARLIALAIAECTNSADQIKRVLEKITGASFTFRRLTDEYLAAYDGSNDTPDFAYGNEEDAPLVTFGFIPNYVAIDVTLNDASKSEVEAYLYLLIPFYIKTTIRYE